MGNADHLQPEGNETGQGVGPCPVSLREDYITLEDTVRTSRTQADGTRILGRLRVSWTRVCVKLQRVRLATNELRLQRSELRVGQIAAVPTFH